jgi:hypothetical protein
MSGLSKITLRQSATATAATPATVPGDEALSVATVATVSVASAQDALLTVKASGARMTTHNGNRIVAVSPAEDSPALRDALRTLGYGACRVLHLDTAPLRGKSSAAISEAIEAAETGGEL